MELRFLDVFIAVMELKSFSKAAERLSLTQPTISSHIKALEDEVGLKLLDRVGRSVVPTRAGTLLYKHAREIALTRVKALQAIKEFKGELGGTVSIGGSTIPGEYLLPKYIGRFRAAFPKVRVTLKISDSRGIEAMLKAGDIELGVVGAKPSDKRFISREFLKDELVLAASARHFKEVKAVSAKDLCRIPLVIREDGSGTRKTLDAALKKAGVDVDALDIAAELGSTEAVKRGLMEGLGMAFVSKYAVENEVRCKSLRLLKVRGIELKRSFFVITDRTRTLSPACKVFTDKVLFASL
ncbi:MAG: selenium metabolism-associated LysR family transcriptional regulator [Deltaproteobacteria bacterium]|nr:selenium metabolism-associated LysR family transcriptional regulator [Deltaproteobacteria bacterium]